MSDPHDVARPDYDRIPPGWSNFAKIAMLFYYIIITVDTSTAVMTHL